jgi:hypothetical protein
MFARSTFSCSCTHNYGDFFFFGRGFDAHSFGDFFEDIGAARGAEVDIGTIDNDSFGVVCASGISATAAVSARKNFFHLFDTGVFFYSQEFGCQSQSYRTDETNPANG